MGIFILQAWADHCISEMFKFQIYWLSTDEIVPIMGENTELKNVCKCPKLLRAHAEKPLKHYSKMAEFWKNWKAMRFSVRAKMLVEQLSLELLLQTVL